MAAVSLLDSEQLVSYQIQSFQVTDRLELQPVADLYRTTAGVAEFPSDEAPLVRARKVPAVLKKARVSVPLALLESMEDIEIAPGTHALRGPSVAITTNMSSGWVGGARRAREMRRREMGTGMARQPVYFRSGHAALQREAVSSRDHKRTRGRGDRRTKRAGKGRRETAPAPGRAVGGRRVDKPSLYLGAHLDFDRVGKMLAAAGKENSNATAAAVAAAAAAAAAAQRHRSAEEKRLSVVARQAQFAPLKGHPLSYLPTSRLSEPQKKRQQEEDMAEDRNIAAIDAVAETKSEGGRSSHGSESSGSSGGKPVLLADGLTPGTGAWGVSQGVHWDDFTEATRNLLRGNQVMHKSVLSHRAVM
jgi:hypothetical protein